MGRDPSPGTPDRRHRCGLTLCLPASLRRQRCAAAAAACARAAITRVCSSATSSCAMQAAGVVLDAGGGADVQAGGLPGGYFWEQPCLFVSAKDCWQACPTHPHDVPSHSAASRVAAEAQVAEQCGAAVRPLPHLHAAVGAAERDQPAAGLEVGGGAVWRGHSWGSRPFSLYCWDYCWDYTLR